MFDSELDELVSVLEEDEEDEEYDDEYEEDEYEEDEYESDYVDDPNDNLTYFVLDEDEDYCGWFSKADTLGPKLHNCLTALRNGVDVKVKVVGRDGELWSQKWLPGFLHDVADRDGSFYKTIIGKYAEKEKYWDGDGDFDEDIFYFIGNNIMAVDSCLHNKNMTEKMKYIVTARNSDFSFYVSEFRSNSSIYDEQSSGFEQAVSGSQISELFEFLADNGLFEDLTSLLLAYYEEAWNEDGTKKDNVLPIFDLNIKKIN